MIISRSKQWAYFCPQKTGTASIRHWLTKHYSGREINKYHHCEAVDVPFAFMTVRNPYDRAVSLWRYRSSFHYETDFDDMIKRYASMRYSLTDWRDRTKSKMFLRLEHLDEDVERLPFWDPAKPYPLHVRETHAPPFELSDDQRALVADLFFEDFGNFGYDL